MSNTTSTRHTPGPIWHVVLLKTHVDDIAEYIDTYANRGHAMARLRGLMRRAAVSELRYAIRCGKARGGVS